MSAIDGLDYILETAHSCAPWSQRFIQVLRHVLLLLLIKAPMLCFDSKDGFQKNIYCKPAATFLTPRGSGRRMGELQTPPQLR